MADKYNISNGTFTDNKTKYKLNGTLTNVGGVNYYKLTSANKLPLLVVDDCWMNKQGGGVVLERLNSGSNMQNGVVTITKYLYFKVPHGEDPRRYNDLDVLGHTAFPQMYSRMSEDPRYVFYGNARIEHSNDDGHYFTASIEYSTRNPNATDDEGEPVTPDTKPWKLKPDNISLSFTDVTTSFQYAYNPEEVYKFDSVTNKPLIGIYGSNETVPRNETHIAEGAMDSIDIEEAYLNDFCRAKFPVCNTAHDPFRLEKTIHNLEIKFSYALQTNDWNINNGIYFGDSINAEEIKVIGITIPAKCGILYPMQADYVNVYKDNGTFDYGYWNIQIRIVLDLSGTLRFRRVLNLGDRAKFPPMVIVRTGGGVPEGWPENTIVVQDEMMDLVPSAIQSYVPIHSCPTPEQIVKVYPLKKILNVSTNTYTFYQTGNPVYMAWSQYISYRNWAIQISSALAKKTNVSPSYDGEVIDLQCEQLTQMPLDYDGTLDMNNVIFGGTHKTLIRNFLEYRIVDWSDLKLPAKGIDWSIS